MMYTIPYHIALYHVVSYFMLHHSMHHNSSFLADSCHTNVSHDISSVIQLLHIHP